MRRTEEIEQARLVKWSHKVAVRKVMPDLQWLHHSPNGGKRDAFTGAQMKAMGTKPGFPDLVLPVKSSDGQFAGLAIEMKAEKGRTSDEQKGWLGHLQTAGWLTAVCYSADEAHLLICAYFGVLPTTVPLEP
jgi:hypothetical protein